MIDKRSTCAFILLVCALVGCGRPGDWAVTVPPSTPRPSSQVSATPTATWPRPTRTARPSVTPTPTWPPTAIGPFQPFSAPGQPAGKVVDLRAAPDGTLWLFTGHSISRLDDGEWITHPVTRGVPVGFDGAGRVWWVSEEGDTISAWGGGAWTTFGAEAGWVKAQPDSGARFREGVTTDKRGVVWLTTSADVRAFDGQRWTLYTGDQLGFTRTQAMIEEGTNYWLTDVIADGEGDVWVADCAWIGESSDGHGARWFTGLEWQGQNSRVVASGCVNDIEVDSAGRIWVGLDGDLWRYTPGQGWDQFPQPPPDPNEQLRWGFVHAITLDPAGVPWVTIQRCGGAGCETGQFALFKVAGDTWIHILEFADFSPGDIAFDAAGDAWLCTAKGLYHITPQALEQVGADQIIACHVEADAAGQVWLAAPGQSTVWLYRSQAESGQGPIGFENTPTPSRVDLSQTHIRYADRPAWQALLGWPAKCETSFQVMPHQDQDSGGIFVYKLAHEQYLAFVMCALGPYWSEHYIYLLDNTTQPLSARLLVLPELAWIDGQGWAMQDALLIHGLPTFDPDTQTLYNLIPARGFKDCGEAYWYRFEQGQFVLSEARHRECNDADFVPPHEWELIYPH